MNRTGDVIWKKYMKDVRQTYGKKNATMIKSVSKMAISLYQELPSSVKNEASGILASFRNGSLPLTVDSINGIVIEIFIKTQFIRYPKLYFRFKEKTCSNLLH